MLPLTSDVIQHTKHCIYIVHCSLYIALRIAYCIGGIGGLGVQVRNKDREAPF
jgi:hypothetical protein